jgi:hypothetical protein
VSADLGEDRRPPAKQIEHSAIRAHVEKHGFRPFSDFAADNQVKPGAASALTALRMSTETWSAALLKHANTFRSDHSAHCVDTLSTFAPLTANAKASLSALSENNMRTARVGKTPNARQIALNAAKRSPFLAWLSAVSAK